MPYRKRGEKWYYYFYTRNEAGKSIRIERVGGTTRKEAVEACRIAIKKYENMMGHWKEPYKKPFSDLWEIFYEEYAEEKLCPATVRTYSSMARTHLLPVLGDIPLADITPRILQNFLNKLAKKKSRGTVSVVTNLLKSIFRYAVSMCQFLETNPAQYLKLPQSDRELQTPHVFSREQIAAIFDRYPMYDKLHMPLFLAYHTGMRLGECLALKWYDVDLDQKEIHIHATMYDDHGVGEVQDGAKTQSSTRTIPIGDTLVHELRKMKKYLLEQRLAHGRYWRGDNFVCCKENGKYLTSMDMRPFGTWCKKMFGAGTFHSLRHTHATLLLEHGEDLELVAKRLGHSNINTTAKVYSHVLEKRKEKSRSLLNQIL